MRLMLRRGVRIAIGIVVIVAVLAVVWRSVDYCDDLRVARQLESLGVKVNWENQWSLRVFGVSLCHVRSGQELATIGAHLDRLSRLDDVELCYGFLSDDDLRYLSNLTTIWRLSVYDMRIDGSGLKYLHRVHKLRWLKLSKTDVNDDTVGNVAVFPHLERLELKHSRVTAKGITELRELARLHTLVLDGSDIDDRVAPILAQMKTLRDLRLDGTEITDAAVEYLAQLKDLRSLWIQDTRITRDGLRKLTQELPNTQIYASQETMVQARQTGQGIEKAGP
jgi:hypothetical protein